MGIGSLTTLDSKIQAGDRAGDLAVSAFMDCARRGFGALVSVHLGFDIRTPTSSPEQNSGKQTAVERMR